MTSLSTFATSLIDHLGLLGVSVGVGLNGLGVPGVSEVLLPLAGVAVREGHQPFGAVLVTALIGQLIGSSLAYAIGRYGGTALIERYGRYILVTPAELHRAQAAFDRHGRPLLVVGAIIPGIQGFMGYIGGIAEVSFGEFLLFIGLGKIIWIAGLVGLGYAVGNHVDVIDQIVSKVGLVVLVLIAALVIWYIRRQHARGTRIKPN